MAFDKFSTSSHVHSLCHNLINEPSILTNDVISFNLGFLQLRIFTHHQLQLVEVASVFSLEW
jgi:hypothetical protein